MTSCSTYTGTSPVSQDLAKMMESGPAMTSASSLSTRGCIPSGPMDLWMSRLFNCSLTRSSSSVIVISFVAAVG
ncbi:hypothetical protein Q9966_010095 [Columba livia]|nr:hypothetical protein Q9966_010095 [Columba livia]